MLDLQHSFGFYRNQSARPDRPERLFFGVWPDAETARRAEQLGKRIMATNNLRGAPVGAERSHVSLQHVGDYPRLRTSILHAATEAARAVSMPPFEIIFRRTKSFDRHPGPADAASQPTWPLVLLAEGEAVRQLHATLGAAMRRNGLRAAGRFVPHMTLFYGSEPVPMQEIEPVRFMVREFRLIHSELGLTRHHTIDRWSLTG